MIGKSRKKQKQYKRSTFIILGLVLTLVQTSAVGNARSLSEANQKPMARPSDDPLVTGPLTLEDKSCKKRNGVESYDPYTLDPVPEYKATRVRECLMFYGFDPAEEGDPLRDYGVVWYQWDSRILRKGLCHHQADSEIDLGKPDFVSTDTVRLESFAPTEGRYDIPSRNSSFTSKLTVEAGGSLLPGGWASIPAEASQTFVATAGYNDEGYLGAARNVTGNGFLFVWSRGYPQRIGIGTPKPVRLAFGAEVSWPSFESAPVLEDFEGRTHVPPLPCNPPGA